MKVHRRQWITVVLFKYLCDSWVSVRLAVDMQCDPGVVFAFGNKIAGRQCGEWVMPFQADMLSRIKRGLASVG